MVAGIAEGRERQRDEGIRRLSEGWKDFRNLTSVCYDFHCSFAVELAMLWGGCA